MASQKCELSYGKVSWFETTRCAMMPRQPEDSTPESSITTVSDFAICMTSLFPTSCAQWWLTCMCCILLAKRNEWKSVLSYTWCLVLSLWLSSLSNHQQSAAVQFSIEQSRSNWQDQDNVVASRYVRSFIKVKNSCIFTENGMKRKLYWSCLIAGDDIQKLRITKICWFSFVDTCMGVL